MFTSFHDPGDPPIHGFLHTPAAPNSDTVVLTHGAGANCQSRLLFTISEALADAGFTVLRFDLPFRNERRFGPPSPGSAERDRDGLRRAVTLMKSAAKTASKEKRTDQSDELAEDSRIFLGGHSYGGRQATILLADAPGLVDALLLLSYPLHPPRKPTQLRTSHFPKLTTPALFVHGTRDPFATADEMHAALKLLPAPHQLLEVEGAGHDLLGKKPDAALPPRIVSALQTFLAQSTA